MVVSIDLAIGGALLLGLGYCINRDNVCSKICKFIGASALIWGILGGIEQWI